MEILGEIYRAAEARLHGDDPDWSGFMAAFRDIFAAEAALYTIGYGPGERDIEAFFLIASSAPEVSDAYVQKKIYRHLRVPENTLAPLEPALRSDYLSDAEFERSGPLADFMIPAGMYHLIAVPALLADGSVTTLTAWRDRGAENFSALEKQRLALFMRHLVALVGKEALALEKPEQKVAAFGRKWGLTPTETELLAALLQGLSLREAAEQSGRSYGTVRWHMQNILGKCQVNSQKDLMREFYTLIRR